MKTITTMKGKTTPKEIRSGKKLTDTITEINYIETDTTANSNKTKWLEELGIKKNYWEDKK